MNDKEFIGLSVIYRYSIVRNEGQELGTFPICKDRNVTMYCYNGRIVEEYRCRYTNNLLDVDFLSKDNEAEHMRICSLYIELDKHEYALKFNGQIKPIGITCCCCNYSWYIDGKTKMGDLPPCPMCEKRWYKFERTQS